MNNGNAARNAATPAAKARTAERVRARIGRRHAAERRFRFYGMAASAAALAMLLVLFASILGTGWGAFRQTMLHLDITFDPQVVDPEGTRDPKALAGADYQRLIRDAMTAVIPEAGGRQERRALTAMVSSGGADVLRDLVMRDPALVGQTRKVSVPASSDVDQFVKGNVDVNVPESSRRISDKQVAWLSRLQERGMVEKVFNSILFSAGDSREPELAGIWGAVVGSLYVMAVTLILSFPLGVAAAVYLEEFAVKNRITDVIEVTINNLAAVPSVVFGLLGLAVFLNFFGLPRSAPLVGGLVLALIILPTIIITGRAALQSVPPSIREAALGVGASRMQTITHHVLPLAMPGILTGTIIGMARALGESAPLLMVGMVAFIVDIPESAVSPATVLPVQVYLWADSAERAFVERTSAAIIVLLVFLVVMNAAAVVLRNKFERRW
ncbi:MAG: phosphate ABC transporter permease PstA [Alphaproteobacteria bacterium]|nr:phosphate ABC transporter permease PstA [Alphaproteobacteria bacterium]